MRHQAAYNLYRRCSDKSPNWIRFSVQTMGTTLHRLSDAMALGVENEL